MCRLYIFHSTEDTKVECTLVHAQNALIAQSKQDRAGYSHSHGWGLVTYEDGMPTIDQQAWAAYHGEHFSRAAARTWSKTVLAHVRRATVGEPCIENTHPFVDGKFSFAHNGTVPRFKDIRPLILEQTSPTQRAAIRGDTDSEHLFRHILTLRDENPDNTLADNLRLVVENVENWIAMIDGNLKVGLNLVISDGNNSAGTRWGRSLFRVERKGIYDCEICGFPHIHHSPNREHQAVVIASEPITHEHWVEIPERSLWTIGAEATIAIEPL